MKSVVLLLMMAWVWPVSAQLFNASASGKDQFASLDLLKLRKDIFHELLQDDLISKKKSQVFVFLQEEGIKVNQVKLSEELDRKYTKILASYDLGRGPNRLIVINPEGIAAGDFWDDSFSGKSEGRLSLPETRAALAALE